ncbi:MAG: Ig-like domain-containing protein [Anaerovoracaceae bacterium]|jgi:LPXTG-motif cell wall-anchored protein
MRRSRVLLSLLILFALLLTTGLAGADNGGGDGSGGGKNITFALIGTEPKDGEKDVPRDVQIVLHFNKNICNVAVLDNNKTCFHLTDGKEHVVPITLIFPDDQVQKDYKRDVVIKPQKKLRADTSYRIAVDRTVQAKNGSQLDNACRITFTTGSSTGAEEPAMLTALGSSVQTFDTALPETEDSIPVHHMSMNTMAMLTAAGILVILILAAYFFIRRRRRRKRTAQQQ